MFRASNPVPTIWAVIFLTSLMLGPGRAEDAPHRPRILEERPCGPDAIRGPLRYLLFQGCAGADFRDACRRHDACYDTIGSDRRACDRKFLEEMLAECPKSKHPLRARYRAHFAYVGVTIAGKGAWKSAQELARKLAGMGSDRS
jgi:hypothetical protein